MSANAKSVISLSAERAKRAGVVGHPSFLGSADPRWDCRAVIELFTQSFDPDLLGIGSTPWLGDSSALGVRVPDNATRSQAERYLIRLLQVEIDKKRAIVIRGIWQYATIRTVPQSRSTECGPVPVELEITSPGWHFQDGNISWHLRYEPHRFSPESVNDPAQPDGASPSMSGQDAALLYVPPFLPYTPPGAGIPPGADVDLLGTWRDMRYLDPTARELSIPVLGPGRVTFYASVHQTNAVTRCGLNIPAGVGRPEDQFVSAFEELDTPLPVVYGRVAGGLAVELFPCCEDLPKGPR